MWKSVDKKQIKDYNQKTDVWHQHALAISQSPHSQASVFSL